MKRIFLLISFFALFTHLSSAQKSSELAKVILASGDTLSILLSYKGLGKIYDRVYYKINKSDPDKILFAHEVKSLKLSSGEEFHSYVVSYDNDSQNLSSLPLTKEPQQIKTDTLFLNLLVQGTLNLYELEVNSRQYFFINKDNKLEELVYRLYTPETQKIVKVNRFTEQLWSGTSDCPSIQKAISPRMSYTKSSIIKIVKNYNTCKGDKPVSSNKSMEGRLQIGLLTELVGEQRKYTGGFKTNLEWSPVVGISFEVKSKKEYRIFSFYTEFKYNNFKGDLALPVYPDKIPVKLDLQNFQMVNMIRWAFFKGKKKVFLNAGIKSSFLLSKEVKASAANMDYVKKKVGISAWDSGFIVGAGLYVVDKNKLKITSELRYSLGVGSIDSNGRNMTSNCIGLAFNFCPRFK